jgi:hypothetical protein
MHANRNSFVYSENYPRLPTSAPKSRFSPKILLRASSLSSRVSRNFVYLLWRGLPMPEPAKDVLSTPSETLQSLFGYDF